MKQSISSFFLLLLLFFHDTNLKAEDWIYDEQSASSSCNCGQNQSYFPNLFPDKIYIGPEIYHVHRSRKGGTKQHGFVYGVRAGYDHIKRSRLYWGGDILWAQGILRGKAAPSDLKSTFRDENYEGRFGYTLQTKTGHHYSFTPYIGYGYFREATLNHF